MEYDDGDIMSIVLSCGRGKKPTASTTATNSTTSAMMSITASDPLSFHLGSPHHHQPPMFPPPPPSLFRAPTGGLEDICAPFLTNYSPDQPRLKEALLISPETKAVEGPKPKQETAARSKKRKTVQQQKVTVQVPAASTDGWAWRKYGQKPIKGVPFPRAYYRCSTRKECAARKQVEKSSADPSMCIVTYSGDHDHAFPEPLPNTPARSPRNRFTSSPSGLSPTTPLTTPTMTADEDEEEDRDGVALHVDDMEIAGPDELIFLWDSSNAPRNLW